MDQITPDEARATGLDHWLNSQSRCFGDKGDVEDITEGQLIGLFSGPRVLANLSFSQQLISYQRSSLIILVIIWRLVTREDV